MSWFVRIKYNNSEWLEGPFENEDGARGHAYLRADGMREGRCAPSYNLRLVRLENMEPEHAINRLADWIEANHEGTRVDRKTGMVVGAPF
jgi:hypothetical protein